MNEQLPTHSSAEILAVNEDEPLLWIARTCSRNEAAETARGYLLEPGGEYVVAETTIRPWTRDEDCEGTTHDEADQEDGDCLCGYYEADGYLLPCSEDHPAAIPAWRVEWIG